MLYVRQSTNSETRQDVTLRPRALVSVARLQQCVVGVSVACTALVVVHHAARHIPTIDMG